MTHDQWRAPKKKKKKKKIHPSIQLLVSPPNQELLPVFRTDPDSILQLQPMDDDAASSTIAALMNKLSKGLQPFLLLTLSSYNYNRHQIIQEEIRQSSLSLSRFCCKISYMEVNHGERGSSCTQKDFDDKTHPPNNERLECDINKFNQVSQPHSIDQNSQRSSNLTELASHRSAT
ncbi:hypothetical protein PGT21_020681 [Puccinia graminis f. sp. tritici]|uniref:Uncharacterized protein n=1 Tax=Puccinia graminis f. sp. tritici TaxID=56615 RepID=A0A5B0S3C1_PUCGR|nr:hypothetical protein PGT21_020681 [Puccinia graminis f. sp. tritici]KAA1131875.1 hypothetical protein PGTUg99_031649 [Puccinia graminis f. sp. tritici]